MRLGFQRRIVHRRAFISRGGQVHAYVLMPNHFHLVVETPQPNLVTGMKWFLPTPAAATGGTITNELIVALVKKNGWKEKDIRQFKELGMKYCRSRNSFTSPPQTFGSFD